MKYAIVKVVNGNYFIHAEGYTDKNAAKVVYHQVCSALWNAEDVQTACIKIVDENLDAVEGYTELINKIEPEPETKTERSSILPD